MRKMLTIATCLVVLVLVGCSSYENSNQLPEEDKFLTPSGIHELPHFISELNNAQTYEVKVYSDSKLSRDFKVDNNVKVGLINGVETLEVSTGKSYFIYETNGDLVSRRNSSESVYDVLPFELGRLNYNDFYYVDFNSMYELKQEFLEEYSVEGLYISYDILIGNVIFSARVDNELTDYTITLNYETIEVPKIYEHTLEGLDGIDLFFNGSEYDSYQSDVFFLDSEQNYIGKYYLQNFHTKEYSRAVYYDPNYEPNRYTYIKYNNGKSEYVDINGNPYNEVFTDPDLMEYSVYKNMFVTDTKLNLYDIFLDSYYDYDDEIYYWYCEGADSLFAIDFDPTADGTSVDPQITIRFRWIDLPNDTRLLWTLKYHSFGAIDYNDFMELDFISNSYVNMIN